MAPAMDVCREELQASGLDLEDSKSVVWSKSGQCPPGCERWWRGGDGFVIVGAPFGRLEGVVGDAPDAVMGVTEDHDHDTVEVAVGTPSFTQRFLDAQERK
eukprot:gene1682-3342_t